MKSALPALIMILSGAAAALAGESAVQTRQEFKQTMSYPYVFRPVCYLANGGPVGMRFESADPSCGLRVPPAAPQPTPEPLPPQPAEEAAAAAPVLEPEEIVQIVKSSPLPEAAPQYPPPAARSQPPLPTGAPDLARIPDEVVDYFRNPYNPPPGQTRYEDPIFRPARPEELPKSTAVYRQE